MKKLCLIIAILLFFSSCGDIPPYKESTSVLSKPTDVTAAAGDTKVTVSWTAVSEATSYNIYWSTSSGAGKSGTKIAGATSPYSITGLSNENTIYIWVTAVNPDGESELSSVVSATPTSGTTTGDTITTTMGSTISIGVGQQKTLSVTDAPSGWVGASRNTGVATISSARILTGVSAGTTQINIYNSSSQYIGQITVNVTASGGTTTSTPMVKGGSDYTIALKSDGTVWAWGYNGSGQLGDGTTTQRNTPVQVSGLTGITAIAVGGRHTIALKSDGTVWAWGENITGQLGDGTTTQRSTPVQVSGLTNVTAIAGGFLHTIALKNDGTVYACGHNQYGQLGDGTTTQRSTPVQVSGLTNVTAFSGDCFHTIVLKSDGTVWAWGYNGSGQLGDASTTNRTTPIQVSGLTGVTNLACGYYHTIALKNDGTVWTWGDNASAQLGDGTRNNRNTPVQVSGLTGVSAVAGGGVHTIILKNDGTVWAWGDNYYGQLGDGTTITTSLFGRTTPIQVSGLTSINIIAGGSGHIIALKNDGTVYACGHNQYGQLGDGTATDRYTPVQVLGSGGTGYLTLK